MSEQTFKALEEIRAKMAEAFGKKPCKIELSVNEAIAVKMLVETAMIVTDMVSDPEVLDLLKHVPMRIQRGLDDVKP